jgi:hypothetical protein
MTVWRQGGRAWSVFAKTRSANTHPCFVEIEAGRFSATFSQSMP